MLGSQHYQRCLEEAKDHHASSKTFSGKFLRPHAPYIKALLAKHSAENILDYGAGKGLQYQWVNHGTIDRPGCPVFSAGQTIEDYWGAPVTKYDPAWPPFAEEPQGQFDVVVCTHTLGAIPTLDLQWVIPRIYSLARKAVYIAEKIGPTKKRVYSKPEFMPHGWTSVQWATLLRSFPHEGVEVCLATRERGANAEATVQFWEC